jgi:poly [ADP-ribose] polymerase 6/8
MTGATPVRSPELAYEYDDCPLLFLVLEICEAFFDLTDHCCICGCELGIAGVKLSLCDKPGCLVRYRDIGIGSSVFVELRRDEAAADLIISLASVSAAPWEGYNVDKGADLPLDLLASNPDFWSRLPSVAEMVETGSDASLVRRIGRPYYEILRRILLSNRAHLIHLDKRITVKECAEHTDQFLVLMTTPEKELAFRQRKAENGAVWLWHGSPATNWFSILQNGLGLRSQGIVFHSPYSEVSLGYSGKAGQTPNKYAKSRYPNAFTLIGLTESVT